MEQDILVAVFWGFIALCGTIMFCTTMAVSAWKLIALKEMELGYAQLVLDQKAHDLDVQREDREANKRDWE